MSMAIPLIQVVPSLQAKAGGLSRAVLGLAGSMGRISGFNTIVASQSQRGESEPDVIGDGISFMLERTGGRLGRPFAGALRSPLNDLASKSAGGLIHSHGIWTLANHRAVSIASRFHLPIVIQPHGMLEPWAMQQKSIKKQIALAIYQRHDLLSAKLLVATSVMEYQSIRAFGLRQPVAVIPHGVDPVGDTSAASAGKDEGGRQRTEPRSVLFLSRIHPKKGLLNLLKAWSIVKREGWRLRIAGGDEGDFLSEVVAEAERLGIGSTVEFLGELEGEAKRHAFESADLFVLPTFSENFGLVVAEALAYGVPVITTRGAPWAVLATEGCGWWIDVGVVPLVGALHEAMELDDEVRRSIGRRGRDYIRQFSWDRIACQMADVYRWLLGRGSRPATVELY